ncbi:hypothetical protein BDD12DRAFT_810550 [Trichophaea hybrida]|nr:hypothetical protein BDD12DRAFT_810550 [Trichophaea hybrida]
MPAEGAGDQSAVDAVFNRDGSVAEVPIISIQEVNFMAISLYVTPESRPQHRNKIITPLPSLRNLSTSASQKYSTTVYTSPCPSKNNYLASPEDTMRVIPTDRFETAEGSKADTRTTLPDDNDDKEREEYLRRRECERHRTVTERQTGWGPGEGSL